MNSNHLSEMNLLRKLCNGFAARGCPATLFAVLFLGTFIHRVSASTFSSGTVDFTYNMADYGYPAYGPGPGVIGSAGDIWNTIPQTDNSPFSLVNTGGGATSLTWSITGGGGTAATLGGAYGKLLDVSTDISAASITGLVPNGQYNFYLYGGYVDETISVNGVNFSTIGTRFGSVDSLNLGSQYDAHTVQADATGTLNFVPVSSTMDPPFISSWQITPVPEPGPISLAGVILALFAARELARRRKRHFHHEA